MKRDFTILHYSSGRKDCHLHCRRFSSTCFQIFQQSFSALFQYVSALLEMFQYFPKHVPQNVLRCPITPRCSKICLMKLQSCLRKLQHCLKKFQHHPKEFKYKPQDVSELASKWFQYMPRNIPGLPNSVPVSVSKCSSPSSHSSICHKKLQICLQNFLVLSQDDPILTPRFSNRVSGYSSILSQDALYSSN